MALFRCRQYPFLIVLDPRDPGRELARFRDGYFQTDDAFAIAELSKRDYIERVDAQGNPARRYTYCAEYRRCGRPNCKCARGQLHGPYMYAYYREGGRVFKRYVGRADAGVTGNADSKRDSDHTRSGKGRRAAERI